MNKDNLKNNFIYLNKEYVEGEVLLFKKSFEINKEINKATIISTALGIYEIYINNKKIDNQLFKPGFQYYNKRLCYQEISIDSFLSVGINEIKIYLSQGWYSGRYYCQNTTKNFGEFNAISYIINIEYFDNTIDLIKSEANDKVYSTKYLYAGLYDGEVVNDNLTENFIGYSSSFEYNGSLEKNITKVNSQEKMGIKNIIKHNEYTIIDFGQNFAGIISINTSFLKENETVTIRHGEILNNDGSLYTTNLRKAKATIIYTKGKEDYIYTPSFTYMGFRYIEIRGTEYKDGFISASTIYTKMDRTGYFESTNNFVNRIYLNALWSQKSNYIEIPTDCPQRDERLGYTGDAHVFLKSGAYNYNTLDFFKNFFIDLRLSQLDTIDHNVQPFLPVPNPHSVSFMTMQGWGSAVSLIPYYLYNQFNDISILEDNYEAIKMYVDLEIKKAGKKNLWNAVSLGDWLNLNKGIGYQAINNHPISNAFFVKDLKILVELSRMFKKEDDYNYYSKKLVLVKEAYIKAFINKKGIIKKDYQGAYVLALKHVLDNSDPIYESVKNNFIKNVKKNGLDTGFFGTEYLLPLLSDFNESKLAYDILLSNKCPSWIYQIDRGATTIWERWDAIKEDGFVNETKSGHDNMVSFNHYSFGSVVEFYYEYILGIKPKSPGFNSIIIKPYTDKRLNKVKGSYKSTSGLIEVSWEYKDNNIYFDILTPVSTTIILDKEYNVEKGRYKYIMKEDYLNG